MYNMFDICMLVCVDRGRVLWCKHFVGNNTIQARLVGQCEGCWHDLRVEVESLFVDLYNGRLRSDRSKPQLWNPR